MRLNDKDFFRLILFIRKKYGIDLKQKREIVEKKITECTGYRIYNSFSKYLDALEEDKENNLSNELISQMTTNYTYFLREFSHFEYLQNSILDNYKERECINIWSAATSTGEEIYSLYMFINEYLNKNSNSVELNLTASDISIAALDTAQGGIYNGEKLLELPDEWLLKYFIKKNDGNYKVTQALTSKVDWRQINLVEPLNKIDEYDIIFLKNVLSYFDPYVINQVVDNVIKTMKQGGYLFIGEKENLITNKSVVKVEHAIYQKIESP